MIGALLAALCTVASPTWVNPQPVVVWDPSQTATGYTVYWREDGVTAWTSCGLEACWWECDLRFGPICTESSPGAWINCRGLEADIGVAIVRCIPREGQTVEVAVTASNAGGESARSNSVTVCMPVIWRSGPYE